MGVDEDGTTAEVELVEGVVELVVGVVVFVVGVVELVVELTTRAGTKGAKSCVAMTWKEEPVGSERMS